jgi:hypothetical protein
MPTSWNSFETPEDREAQKVYDAAFSAAIQTLRDMIGPNIKITLTNEYGASVQH